MKTLELIAAIRKRIAGGYAGADGRLPNIGEIAKDFSVSPMTAQKAIRALVEAGVLTSTRRKGVFLKQPASSGMARVGIVSMYYTNCTSAAAYLSAFSSYLISGVEILKSTGIRIVRLDRDDLKGKPEQVKQILEELDSMIITYGCLDNDTLPYLLSWRKPVVVIQHEEFCAFPFHQVIPDLESGFARLALFFAERKISRLLVATNREPIHLARVRVLKQVLSGFYAMRDCHIETLEVPSCPSDLGRIAGQRLGELILRTKVPYDVIVTPSDFIAFGVIDTMSKSGKSFGVDYRLVSYDNLEADSYLPLNEPVLTCVGKHPDRISAAAANLILSLKQLGAENRFLCKVPCDLTIRQTMT